jgi:hypothetical protein
VEGVNALPRRRDETEVQTGFQVGRHRMLSAANPERNGDGTIAERVLALAQTVVTERLERRIVETFCPGYVADADGEVVDQGCLLLADSGELRIVPLRLEKCSASIPEFVIFASLFIAIGSSSSLKRSRLPSAWEKLLIFIRWH